MPRPFDPEAVRRSFDEVLLGYLATASREPQPLPGNAARLSLATVISAWLVDVVDEVEEPLRACEQWLVQSIRSGEQSGEDGHFHKAVNHEALGLCRWMLGRETDEPYRRAVESWEKHFEDGGMKRRPGGPRFDYVAQRYESEFISGLPMKPKEILQGSLHDYLASCVQCGEFTRGAALFEKVGGKTDLADSRIQTPVHFGYWLCKHGAAGTIPVDDAAPIAARVLRANLRTNWLAMGQDVRAAQWLKIVARICAWNLDAREVILRADDFMPDVRKL